MHTLIYRNSLILTSLKDYFKLIHMLILTNEEIYFPKPYFFFLDLCKCSSKQDYPMQLYVCSEQHFVFLNPKSDKIIISMKGKTSLYLQKSQQLVEPRRVRFQKTLRAALFTCHPEQSDPRPAFIRLEKNNTSISTTKIIQNKKGKNEENLKACCF